MHIDTYAIITQADADGGDSLAREGMWAFGRWLRLTDDNQLIVERDPERQEPSKIIDKFEIKPGIFVRHPDPRKWYSNPWTLSRDQIIPVLAYCAAYEDHGRLWRIFKAHALRGFFAQNLYRNGDEGLGEGRKIPDTILGHLGLFIRAGGWYTAPLYPALFVTDLLDTVGLVLSAVPLSWSETRGAFRATNPNDVDDNNQIIAMLMAAKFKPTPISYLNRKLYVALRPRNNGNFVLGEKSPVMGALAWYHRLENNGIPELAELYRSSIERYF